MAPLIVCAPTLCAQSLSTATNAVAQSVQGDPFSERDSENTTGTSGSFASAGVSTGDAAFSRATASYGSLKTLVDVNASDPGFAIADARASFTDTITIQGNPADFPFTAITVVFGYRFDGLTQITGDAQYTAQFRVSFESQFDVNKSGTVAFTTTVGEIDNGNGFGAALNEPFTISAEMQLRGSASDGRALVDLENTGALTGVTVMQGPNVVDPTLYTVVSTSGEFAFDEGGCAADLNGDGIADNGDISVFVQLFLASDAAADFNGDGIPDNGDIGAFVQAFLAGC